MLSVSERFKKAFEQVDKPRKIKAIVTLKNVSYKNDQLFHVEYNSEAISGDTFAIGSTFSNNVKVTIDKVVEGIKQQDQLTYQLGIVVEPNETELADMKSKGYTWDVIEYVPMGTFFVTSYNPDRNENRTIIEASDSMSFLESTYSSNLTYPAYLKDIALDVANKNGLVVDSGSLSRLPQIQIKRPEKVSYRQVLGIIAQYQKGFATFDRQNRLAIRALSDPKYTISTNNYFLKGLVKEELLYKVDGISCKVEKEEQTTVLQAGKTAGNQIVLENSSMTQIDLNTIFSGLSTLNYYPYSLKWRGNPALEVGDWISLNDIKTNSFKVPNLSYKLTFSGGLTAESSAHTKSISETTVQYRGPLNQKIEDITGWISAAGGFSYTGLDEPQNPKEKDVWFKPNGPDMEMWIFEDGKWKLETSTADVRELSEAFEESHKKIEQAEKDLTQTKLDLIQNAKDIEQNKADIAQNIKDTDATAKQLAADKVILDQTSKNLTQTKSDLAADKVILDQTKAGLETTKSNLAEAKTQLAKTAADLVVTNKALADNKVYIDNVKSQADVMSKKIDDQNTVVEGNTAIANAAKIASDQAQKDVAAANALANTAKAVADGAKSDATLAKSNAATAVSNANTAVTNAKSALDKANTVDQSVQTEVSRINGELSSKATQTSLNTLSGTVSTQGTQITQNKDNIALKANQTTVNTLTGTVNSQGTLIQQNKDSIALKANQSTVETLTGRVTSAESSIKVNANSITSLVTKTDGTNTQVSSLKQTVDGFTTTVANVRSDITNLTSLSASSMIQNGSFSGGDIYWNIGSTSYIRDSTYNGGMKYIRLEGSQTNTYTGGIEFKKGHTYRLSILAYVQNGWTGSPSNTKARLGNKTSGELLLDILIATDSSKFDQWVQYDRLYTAQADIPNVELTLRNSPNGVYFVGYSYVMLNDVTDTLAISNDLSQFKQDVNGFQSLIASTYETKNVVTSKVSAVQQDLNGFKTTASQTYSTKGELGTTNTKVGALESNINGFKSTVSETYVPTALLEKTGSTSLVTNGDFAGKSLYWNLSDTASIVYNTIVGYYLQIRGSGVATYTGSVVFKKGRTYRIRFMAFLPGDWTGAADNTKVRIGDSAGNLIWTRMLNTSGQKDAWVDYSDNFTPTKDLVDPMIELRGYTSNGSRVCYTNVFIDDVTDILDTNSRVSTLSQTVEGFKTTVSATYETKTNVTNKISTVEQTISKFQTQVGNTYTTKDEFGNIVVPGDNLVVNSGEFEDTSSWRLYGSSGVPSSDMNVNVTTHPFWFNSGENLLIFSNRNTNEVYIGTDRFKIKADTQYTLVIKGFHNSLLSSVDVWLLARRTIDTTKDYSRTFALKSGITFSAGEVIEHTFTFRTPKDMLENEAYLRIDNNGTKTAGQSASFYLCNISFREGNLVAGWAPSTGNAYTMIKQTKSDIALNVVQKDKVVSSINLNPEGIRLQGKLITLDGTSYIATSVIKDAHIENATITSASIKDLAVTGAKIAQATITDANIQNATILTASIKDAAITNAKIGELAVSTAKIANASIQEAKIANLAVTNAKIANLAVDGAKIANATIQEAKIADLAVTNAKIANATITTAKIGDLAVTNAKIGDLAVNGAKIANAAITEAKIGEAAIINAHIKDATIESAKIKSISAEKITAGTLNAANVNIINLNANNITSGNINGISITGSTVTSQKGSSRIVLDGGALSWYVSNGLVGSIYTNEDSGITQASWDVYDSGYFSIRGKGSYNGELYMRYGWGALKSIVSGKVSIVSKNTNGDRSTEIQSNNSEVILVAYNGSRSGKVSVGAYGTSVTGGLVVSGGLSVTGSKNAIHQVDGQWYATPAYETAESYLGDIGSTKTNNDSMVLIPIDNLFGRIVNTSLEYQVFVSSYGSGHVWVEKRMQNAFIVRSSEPNTSFAWEIKAKRKGYEQERLVKHSLIA